MKLRKNCRRMTTLYVKMQLMKKCTVLLPSLNHCTKHLEHLRCPLINCYVVLPQSRMQTSGKVSLQLLVEQMPGIRANASIRVQPTAMCRRTDGVTRISKRLACRRPAMGTKRASKRPRNLANAISHNQPNAKSHGCGH